jgi:biotin carboxylase
VGDLDIPYPFWLKPVRSYRSHLGFRINNEDELRKALEVIREHIGRIGAPFEKLLEEAELPEAIQKLSGSTCIAERIISGEQCTVEGYEYGGEVVTYGVIDSVREPNLSSFSRYQYPSSIPAEAQERMKELSERFILGIGYRGAPFNIEFFYEEPYDQVWLLEVNTRISKSHAPLFELVHGTSHHEVMIDLALGERPRFPIESGEYQVAAKFMVREYEDARVKEVPDPERIKGIEARFPAASIHLHVEEGMMLSELTDQDSYTYEVASIYLGARDQKELLDHYYKILEELGLSFEREVGLKALQEKRPVDTINLE